MKGILFLLLLSTLSYGRCFVHVFLGAADAGRHFHRAEWVEERAQEMGCLVFKTHDLSVSDTDQKLIDFMAKHNFDASQDRLHISYVDHGSSSSLPYGGGYERYQNVLNNLDNAVPKGTDVTFSSHICWPGFNDQLANHNFKNIKSMCGGTSVDSDNLSTAWSANMAWARNREYLPAGWDYWATEYDDNEGNDFLQAIGLQGEDREAGHRHTNMFNFHYQSIDNDAANLLKGSSLTSLTFARNKLKQIGHDTYKNPRNYLFNDLMSNSVPLYSRDNKVLGESKAHEVCYHCSETRLEASGIDDIFKLKEFADQLDSAAVQTEIDRLANNNSTYQVYSEMFRNSREFIRLNMNYYKNLASQYAVRFEAIRRNLRNAANAGNTSQEAAYQEQYEELEADINKDFKNLFVELRKLNDVEMIVKLKEESPESMQKFESFMACERRNALDIL